MSHDAQDGSFQVLAPTETGKQAVQRVVTAAAAANANLWSGYSAADRPKGWVWLTFEGDTADCFIRLKPTATTASTTASNGTRIAAGAQVRFWVPSHVLNFVDVIANSAGALKWYVSSPDSYRTNGITGA